MAGSSPEKQIRRRVLKSVIRWETLPSNPVRTFGAAPGLRANGRTRRDSSNLEGEVLTERIILT